MPSLCQPYLMPPLVVCRLPLIAQLHARDANLRLLMHGQHWKVARQQFLYLEVIHLPFPFGRCIATPVEQGIDLRIGIATRIVEGLSLLDRLAVVGAGDPQRWITGGRIVLQGRVEIVVAVDALEDDRPFGAIEERLDAHLLPVSLKCWSRRGVLGSAGIER